MLCTHTTLGRTVLNFHCKPGKHLFASSSAHGKSHSSLRLQASSKNGVERDPCPKGNLRLLLDSANVNEWRRWASTGLFYGVTTNPSILQRDGVPCTMPSLQQLADTAVDKLGLQEVQFQAWGGTADALTATGLRLAQLKAPVVVKLPITQEGVIAAARLIRRTQVPITLTGIYTAHQALTAIACGATYAAPYLGRMDDAGKDGIAEILSMQRVVEGTGSSMRLLVASVRKADDLVRLASQGCDTFTISPACAAQLFDEPLTIRSAHVFEQAALDMQATR